VTDQGKICNLDAWSVWSESSYQPSVAVSSAVSVNQEGGDK
jgi:hypothetical protein